MEARRADDAARAAVRDKQMHEHQKDMRKRLAEFHRRDAATSEEMMRVKQWEVREAGKKKARVFEKRGRKLTFSMHACLSWLTCSQRTQGSVFGEDRRTYGRAVEEA